MSGHVLLRHSPIENAQGTRVRQRLNGRIVEGHAIDEVLQLRHRRRDVEDTMQCQGRSSAQCGSPTIHCATVPISAPKSVPE